MGLSVILTCFNEVPLIFDSHRELASLLAEARVPHEFVIVDDGSAPQTREALIEHFRDVNDAEIILAPRNEGRGAAVSRGIRASHCDFVGFADTDLEIPGWSLVALYNEALHNDADLVLADRVLSWEASRNNWLRNLGSLVVRHTTSWRLSLGDLDTATGAKVFRRASVLPLLDRVTDTRWFWDTEVVAEAVRNGQKVVQVPVVVHRRAVKKTSMHLVRDAWRQFAALESYRRRVRARLRD